MGVPTLAACMVVSNDEERKDQIDSTSPDQAGFEHFDSFYKLNLELVQDLDDQRETERCHQEVDRHICSFRPVGMPEWQRAGGETVVRTDRLRSMPEFEVRITEMSRSIELPADPNEPTPQIRIQVWRGEAADAAEATEKTWQQWDRAYGSGNRPDGSTVEVTPR